jgi:hypothetical protein
MSLRPEGKLAALGLLEVAVKEGANKFHADVKVGKVIVRPVDMMEAGDLDTAIFR